MPQACTPAPPAPPSCCAGLRQAALHGWQQDFPLHASPFQQMAARCGATPRELLAQCQALQRDGALAAIRVRWADALPRQRVRLGFAAEHPQDLLAALQRLPGCSCIEQLEGNRPADLPGLWAELEARDAAALQAQLAALPEPPLLRLSLAQGLPGSGGPWQDLPLAAAIEQGLPLQANPFLALAARLGRSERQVLASLLRWQREGLLAHLTLQPPEPEPTQTLFCAAWREAPDPALPGLESVAPEGAPWRFRLTLYSAPAASVLRHLAPPWHGLLRRSRRPARLFLDDYPPG